ncbi:MULTISPECIES: hypothetical protein [Streptomyces]
MNTNEALKRYEVKLIKKDRTVNTHTWETTRARAVARIADHLEDPIWEGYEFEVAKKPS